MIYNYHREEQNYLGNYYIFLNSLNLYRAVFLNGKRLVNVFYLFQGKLWLACGGIWI